MRTSIKTLVSAAALSAMLATGVVIGQAMAAQPHMMNALSALQSARRELVAASPDKGGHRAKAIQLVDAAAAQVKAGMAFSAHH
jgi:hypothetical protein